VATEQLLEGSPLDNSRRGEEENFHKTSLGCFKRRGHGRAQTEITDSILGEKSGATGYEKHENYKGRGAFVHQ